MACIIYIVKVRAQVQVEADTEQEAKTKTLQYLQSHLDEIVFVYQKIECPEP